MPKKHTIIPGKRYGSLTVIKDLGWVDKFTRILVRCDCGEERVVRYSFLSGRDNCSCMRCAQSRHGYAGKYEVKTLKGRTYKIWAGMLQRCLNDRATYYIGYGGRGISVCERWLDFANFLSDMGELPSNRHSIERIDVDGNYEPSNCAWIIKEKQAGNRRNVRKIEYDGRSMTIADWAREMGLGERMLWMRLSYGWSIERTLTTPSARKNPAKPPKPIPES